MTPSSGEPLQSEHYARVGRWLCIASAVLGALGLLGWTVGVGLPTRITPGEPGMTPNVALTLILLGTAGALRHRRGGGRITRTLSRSAALVSLAIALATLLEHAFTLDFGIDRILALQASELDVVRPAPASALTLALLAAALLLFDWRPRARARPSEWLLLAAGIVALAALMGFAFNAGVLQYLLRPPVIGVALPAAVGYLFLSVGLLLERPDAGLMRIATSAGPGGTLLRRLALPVTLGPMLLGFLTVRLLGQVDIGETSLILSVVSSAMVVLALFVLAVTVSPLNRAYEALTSSRARVRGLIEQAPDGIFIADLTGRYTDVNLSGCRMLGYAREELVGKTIFDLISPQEVERLLQSKEAMLHGKPHIGEWMLRRKDGSHLPVEVNATILPDGRWQGLVRDISERRRLEEERERAQERFALALKGAGLGYWDWNIKTGHVYLSPRWAEMRGFHPQDVRPHVDSWASGVHPEDMPEVQKALADHFQGITSEYRSEHRVRTRSGKWMWIVDLGKVFVRDEHGAPVRMVGVELDIDERKRLEEALRLAEAKSSGIVSVSVDAIISVDREHRITLFNEGAQRIFGYSNQEAMGAPLELLFPARFRGVHRQHIERFAAGAESARRIGERVANIIGLRKNGEEFPAEAAISMFEVGGTEILTVALRDISEQKRIDNEQKFLAEFGTVVASTLDVEEAVKAIAKSMVGDLADVDVCVLDARRGREEGDYLVVSHRDHDKVVIVRELEAPQHERQLSHLGSSVLRTRQPILVPSVGPEHLSALELGDAAHEALRRLNPKSLMALPLLAYGQVVGALTVIRTTNRPYRQKDLAFAEQVALRAAMALENARLYRVAQRAIRIRDEVIGVVAHDLRNPLSTVLLQGDLLRRQSGEDSLSKGAAGIIERAATRMNHLIQDLLDVARLEGGTLFVEPERVPAEDVVSDSVEAQAWLASSASLHLRLDIRSELPEIWADRERLMQVFENLIGNSIKFTRPGGHITVGAKRRGNEVLFWVADTGVGIPTDALPHVFERFWQTRKASRTGAGLGLSIVKGIVEAHGGRVWAESQPERGSTFFFTIPTAPRQAESPRRAVHP